MDDLGTMGPGDDATVADGVHRVGSSFMAGGPAFAVIVLGALLLAAGAAEVWVGRKAESVADLVRPEMTDAGLAQHRSDFETARAAVEGLQSDVLPAVAGALGVSEAALTAAVQDYPAVARLMDDQDEIIPFAEQSLVNLERQQDNFEDADSLPLASLPGWAGGTVTILLACLLVGLGVWMFRVGAEGRPWLPVMLCGAAAVTLLVAPLALRYPAKAGSAQTVLDSLNPSEAVVARTEAAMLTTEEGVAELQSVFLPDVASTLGMSTAQFEATLAREFPEVARGQQEMPAILERYQARLKIRQDGAPALRTLKDIPIARLAWTDPAFGVVLGAIAGWLALGVARERAKRQTPAAGG
jgi:hypothetical protein